MARPKAPPTAEELFLAPLAKFGETSPELDTLVFWQAEAWRNDPNEDIEAEETAFYAEGLIEEGFCMIWRLLALAGETEADHARLYVWQEGTPPPAEIADWVVLEESQWVKA